MNCRIFADSLFPARKAGDMGVVNEMRNRNVGPQGQVRAPTRRSRLGHVSMLSLSALALLCFVHHCSALKKLDLDDLEDLEKNDDMQGGSGKMELKRGQEKEDARSMKLPREEVKMGQTHDHLYGDRESSYSGDGIPTSSGHLDVSVAKMEAIFAAIRPAIDPIKLLFGLGLLFYGRSFAHVILFAHSFNISGWPLLWKAICKFGIGYHAYTSGMDKRSANAIKAIGAALHPEQVTEAFRGLHYGLVSCLASVVSPLAGAAGVGLSLGKSIDRHVQPFLRRYVMTDKRLKALTSARMRLWVDTLTTHASEGMGMAAGLLTMSVVNILSGCMLGAQLVVDVALVHVQHQLKRFALRSDHALLHKVAANFNPKHVAAGGITYVVALTGFLSQLRRGSGSMSLPVQIILFFPVLLEKMLSSFKFALLARRTPPAA